MRLGDGSQTGPRLCSQSDVYCSVWVGGEEERGEQVNMVDGRERQNWIEG